MFCIVSASDAAKAEPIATFAAKNSLPIVDVHGHLNGDMPAEQLIIRTMLATYPNLYCDLGGMLNAQFAPYGSYWPKRTPWMFLIEDGKGNLFPEMKALYESFPNRFFLGTDPAFTQSLRHYPRRIERFRELLSGLRPETARRLAVQNADEIFQKK